MHEFEFVQVLGHLRSTIGTSKYCSTEQQKKAVLGPLACVDKNGQIDVSVNVP